MTESYTGRNTSMEATISQLCDYFTSIPDSHESYMTNGYREMVYRVIDYQGSKEIHHPKDKSPSGFVGDIVYSITYANLDAHNKVIKDKINYTTKLFHLIQDRNIPDFFKDLEHGLDNAIDNWDNSPVPASAYNYQMDPSGAIIRYYLWPLRKC